MPSLPNAIVRQLVRFVPVLPLLVGPSASGQATERRAVGGNAVAIYNLAGRVRVEGGAGSDVVVEITRGGAAGGSR